MTWQWFLFGFLCLSCWCHHFTCLSVLSLNPDLFSKNELQWSNISLQSISSSFRPHIHCSSEYSWIGILEPMHHFHLLDCFWNWALRFYKIFKLVKYLMPIMVMSFRLVASPCSVIQLFLLLSLLGGCPFSPQQRARVLWGQMTLSMTL